MINQEEENNIHKPKSFEIPNFEIIKSPKQFYKMIIQKISIAKKVYIACMFMGHKKQAKNIVDILETRIKTGKLTVICLDKIQHLRFGDFINDMKQREIYDKIHFIDNNPNCILPNLIKELLGVFHDKVFIFDNEVCITGANLDWFYFSNRIDRYYLFNIPELSEFLTKNLFENFLLKNKIENNIHKLPIRIAQELLFDNMKNNSTKLFHFTNFYEIEIMKSLLLLNFDHVYIATGYLNFSNEHIKVLKDINCSIFTVSPKSNKFDNIWFFGKILAGIYAYSTYKTSTYLPKAKIYQFYKKDYTFHTKGLWIMNKNIGATILGSSNYNRRSQRSDHESIWVMISNNKKTLKKWNDEIASLKDACQHVTELSLSKKGYMLIAIVIYYIFNKFL